MFATTHENCTTTTYNWRGEGETDFVPKRVRPWIRSDEPPGERYENWTKIVWCERWRSVCLV